MAFCSSGRFVQYTQILIVLHYKSNMIRKKQEHSVKFWLVCLLVKCMSHMIPLTSHITYSYAPTSPLKKGGKWFCSSQLKHEFTIKRTNHISKETHIARAI